MKHRVLTAADWRNAAKIKTHTVDPDVEILVLDLDAKAIWRLVCLSRERRRELVGKFPSRAATQRDFDRLRKAGAINIVHLAGVDSNVPDCLRGYRRRATGLTIRALENNWGLATDPRTGKPCKYATEAELDTAWHDLVVTNPAALEV